jgi:hypothetical protein
MEGVQDATLNRIVLINVSQTCANLIAEQFRPYSNERGCAFSPPKYACGLGGSGILNAGLSAISIHQTLSLTLFRHHGPNQHIIQELQHLM